MFQVSASCIQLLEVLSHSRLQNTPILLVYNKTDLPCAMPRHEFESIIRLEVGRCALLVLLIRFQGCDTCPSAAADATHLLEHM